MKVKELISELQRHNPDANVFIRDSDPESSFYSISSVSAYRPDLSQSSVLTVILKKGYALSIDPTTELAMCCGWDLSF